MSVVTGFVLICEYIEPDWYIESQAGIIEKIWRWLSEDPSGNSYSGISYNDLLLENPERPEGNIKKIWSWLDDRGFARIEDLSEKAVGSKHPELSVFVAGYNEFPEDEFIDFFYTLSWTLPEDCVLSLTPEWGGTRVLRPQGLGYE